jgi:membrane protease YdiL (CAAX protease family)
MNGLSEVDHLLAAGLALMSLSLLFRKAPPATPGSRRDFYVAAAGTGLLLAGITLSLWYFAGRPLGEFGLLEWVGDPVVTGVSAAIWVLILLMWLAVIGKSRVAEWVRPIYSKYDRFMPVTRGDLAGSWAASVAAGSGEEIVYRGFLLWYCANLTSVPVALVVTSILFGIAHGYQSRFGVIFATAAGMCLGAVYLASESLLLVMWMHATYNVASFTSGKILLARQRAPVADG